jgi:hypothetical protein
VGVNSYLPSTLFYMRIAASQSNVLDNSFRGAFVKIWIFKEWFKSAKPLISFRTLKPHEVSDFPLLKMRAPPCKNLIMD